MKPIIILAAIGENGELGKDNQLLWRLPQDLQRFKQLTLGNPLIMGRATYESIGRPLPGRLNIILTRDQTYSASGCEIAHSWEAALALASRAEGAEIMVIGGAQIFALALPIASKIYLTQVHAKFPRADVYFPVWDPQQWKEISRADFAADDKNEYAYTFIDLVRAHP